MSGTASHPLRWRPLTPFLLAVGALLLIVAVLDRDPVPLFLALPLLLAPVAAAIAGPRSSLSVRVTGGVVGAVTDVTVREAVVPDTGVDARNLVVELHRPVSLVGDASPRLEYTPSEIRIQANWKAPEPVITEVGVPFVLWRDPMGLVEREAVSTAAPIVVTRYPSELLRIGAVHLERTTPLPGETRSRKVGESGEFHGIRSARPDDPPRQINWRASARAGRLLANEYDLDKTGDLLIILDARPTPLGPTFDKRLFDISRAAAVGLSDSFLRVKSRVGLGVFGEFLDIVPLSSGRVQRIRLEAALRRARLSPTAAPPERCAVAVRRQFPPGLTTVVFSSLSDDPSSDLSPYLRRRGFPGVVVSPSPLPLLATVSPLTGEDEAIASRIAKLVRRNRISHAWQETPTIDWADYWSLGEFVEFLRRPRTRRLG